MRGPEERGAGYFLRPLESRLGVSGHVLLNDAAVATVSRWRCRPTLLNGGPVSVILTVAVSFDLR